MDKVNERVREDLDVVRGVFDDSCVCFGVVFGSSVTGGFRGDSDVDVAVWFEGSTDSMTSVSLENRLEEEVGRRFDVVDLECVSGRFASRIFEEGVVFYDPDGVCGVVRDSVVVSVSKEEIDKSLEETRCRLDDLDL